MAKSENQKLKILVLAKLFEEETDECVGVSMPEIITRLAEQGISAERKSIYRDIEALRSFGMDIQTRHTPHVEYYLANRTFDLSELRLITDAIQSSRFLTHSQADQLAERLQSLLAKQQRWQLEGSVHVKDRITHQSESAFGVVDAIRAALTRKSKIAFTYLEFDTSGKRRLRKSGATYLETPVSLIYANNLYYLIAFNEKHDDFVTYRVDRMAGVTVSEEPALRNARIANFDPAKHVKRAFGMYAGEEVTATFLVKNDVMNAAMDRFFSGDHEEVAPGSAHVMQQDEDYAVIRARIMESPVFYAWLTQFGDSVIIQSPTTLAQNYRSYLESILAGYACSHPFKEE